MDAKQIRDLSENLFTKRVTLNSLRGQIGIVLQETLLFATTIRENIAFGRVDDKERGHIDYLKGANIGGFIKVADAMLAFGHV